MKVHSYRIGSRRVRATPRSGTRPPKRFRRLWAPYKHRELLLYIIGLVLVICVIAPVPLHYWYRAEAGRTFATHVAQGASLLRDVEVVEDYGRYRLMRNEAYQYPDLFPTTGPHDPDWISPGFYNSPRGPTFLVRALARGIVVIYYDQLKLSVLETLKNWAALFPGDRDGLIVVAHPGLDSGIVLTAWTRRLRLASFDPDAAAAFIDAYRGRGPEGQVR